MTIGDEMIDDFHRLSQLGAIDPQKCDHTRFNRMRILAQNRLFRAAYDKVRGNPERRAAFEEIAEALTGAVPPKNDHIRLALRILESK